MCRIHYLLIKFLFQINDQSATTNKMETAIIFPDSGIDRANILCHTTSTDFLVYSDDVGIKIITILTSVKMI